MTATLTTDPSSDANLTAPGVDANLTAPGVDANLTAPGVEYLEAAGISLPAIIAVNAIIAAVTVFGNVCVLVAFGVNPKLRSRNRAMTLLVINLAAVDLFNGAVAVPWYVVPQYGAFHLTSYRAVCILTHLVPRYSVLLSVFTTQAIAVERYVGIMHPFWDPPRWVRALCRPAVLLPVLWLYPAAVLGIPSYLTTRNKTWDVCRYSKVFALANNAIESIHCIAALAIQTTLYIRIWFAIRKSRKQVEQFQRNSGPRSQEVTSEPDKDMTLQLKAARQDKRAVTVTSQDIRVVKTFALILGVFYLTFLPLFLLPGVNVALGFPVPAPPFITAWFNISFTITMLGPCLDPFVYGWRNKKLRKAICDMFHCHWKRTVVVNQTSGGTESTSV